MEQAGAFNGIGVAISKRQGERPHVGQTPLETLVDARRQAVRVAPRLPTKFGELGVCG